MLNLVRSNDLISLDEARNKYKNSKVIFLVNNKEDMNNIQGTIYAVSNDIDSFDELLNLNKDLTKSGKITIVIGSYENGVGLGVQYEVK